VTVELVPRLRGWG